MGGTYILLPEGLALE